MTGLRIIIPLIWLIFHVSGLRAQELILNSSVTGVCYAGTKVNRMYIPPPPSFKKGADSKGGAEINIIYSGFPAEARVPAEYAVSILRSLLPADAGFTLKLIWQRISSSGVLANSTITSFAGGWSIDAFNPYAFYPVALAEKIAGKALNDESEPDIEIIFNSSVSWYFGTDGNTPVTQYDLVTVVLHECFHGLGFFDSMDTDGTLGWYGAGSIPVIYDTFVGNLTEKRLTDTLIFENYSPALRDELTGGQLYFSGPLFRNLTSGSRARLYSPATWDPGSSVSHLDETRTPAVHSLMTPFIDRGEAIHDPGSWTLTILGEMGWINTRIIHKPLNDTEEPVAQVEIKAVVRSDTLYNRDNVRLIYSFDGFNSSSNLFMTSLPGQDNYTASIAIPGYNVQLEYYLFAEDIFLREFKLPSRGEAAPLRVYIGTDTVKPRIVHTPLSYVLDLADTIIFEAEITDNIGVDTAFLEYRINNGPLRTTGMSVNDSVSYTAEVSFKSELMQGGDRIEYRITAIDKANSPNIRIMPLSGYYEIAVEGTNQVSDRYTTDFTGAGDDFFMTGFEVTKPPSFSDEALHTRHPYESPDMNDSTLEYTALLRYPIRYDANGMFISFREIVLVEPGEDDSVYGSDYFYDYVIIEATKDFGKTWFGLTDGYDSRFNPAWLSAYNSTIVGMNSTYTGKESDYINRVLHPVFPPEVKQGDTLLIRFRLFSDPYANGWGWAIDDFRINPLIGSVWKPEVLKLTIYPNPGNGIINVSAMSDLKGRPVFYSVFNFSGVCVINNRSLDDSGGIVDISDYPSGIYFISFRTGEGVTTLRYSLIR